jgi:uncharacterized RDD family membrane protein YckC
VRPPPTQHRPAAAPAPAAAPLDVDPDVSVEEIEIHLRRAAPWKRATSWAVDGLPLGLLGALLFHLVASMSGLSAAGGGPTARQTGLDWVLDAAARHQGLVLPTLAVLAAASFVHATLGHALMGATLGKRLLGLRVVARDGRRPTLGRSAIRAALSLLSFLLLGLGCLLALFTVSGRALHDFLAGTYVVESDRTLP